MTLPGTQLATTSAGFGCAGLFREPHASERRRLLEAAYSNGVRHYDVAPMYGLGLAERELGRFARSRRDQLVIATKFGVTPTSVARSLGRVQAPVRRLLRKFPALQRQVRSQAAGPTSGKAGALLYGAAGFDAGAAQASLERSLKEIGTDYVDILLLHDPQPGAVCSDEVCAYLEKACAGGKIRSWGIAGESTPSLAVARELSVTPPVLQLRGDALTRCARETPAAPSGAHITFGVLACMPRIVAIVANDQERRRCWQEIVGQDCATPEVVASLLLRQAARENPDGVVLFSTVRVDHLRSSVAALSTRPDRDQPDVDAFARLARAALRKELSHSALA